MAADPDAQRFITASLVDRAILLLQRAFRDPNEPVSRVNVAAAIAAQGASLPPGSVGGSALPGSSTADPRVMRLVSEAWQVLEAARFVCRDLSQPSGDWWVLTALGRGARESTDPEGEIRLRVPAL